MDVNNLVYESIKNYMSGEKDNILIKICMGNASEEEKKKWSEENDLPEEVVTKLKECCDTGYNMASNLDKEAQKSDDMAQAFKQALEDALEEQKRTLTQTFTQALEEQKRSFTQALEEQKNSFTQALEEQKRSFKEDLEDLRREIETLKNV
jgi:exonuclease VII large subunit